MKELEMTGKSESREEHIIACQVSNDQRWKHTYKQHYMDTIGNI